MGRILICREEEEEHANGGKIEANVWNLEGLGSSRKASDYILF